MKGKANMYVMTLQGPVVPLHVDCDIGHAFFKSTGDADDVSISQLML